MKIYAVSRVPRLTGAVNTPKNIIFRPGVFNLLYHATPLTDFGMLAAPHNDNVKIELRR